MLPHLYFDSLQCKQELKKPDHYEAEDDPIECARIHELNKNLEGFWVAKQIDEVNHDHADDGL